MPSTGMVKRLTVFQWTLCPVNVVERDLCDNTFSPVTTVTRGETRSVS
jgi:hypothetical protein